MKWKLGEILILALHFAFILKMCFIVTVFIFEGETNHRVWETKRDGNHRAVDKFWYVISLSHTKYRFEETTQAVVFMELY